MNKANERQVEIEASSTTFMSRKIQSMIMRTWQQSGPHSKWTLVLFSSKAYVWVRVGVQHPAGPLASRIERTACMVGTPPDSERIVGAPHRLAHQSS